MTYKQPQVFLTITFLKSFAEKLVKTTSALPIEERKKLIFIEDLIFQNSNIYLNLSDLEILDLIEIDSKSELTDINMCIKKIAAVNKIRSCLREWNDYAVGDVKKIAAHDIIPNFILCHADEKLCKDIEVNYGLITISQNLSISTSLMNVENMIIADNQISDPFSFFKSLSRCHSVVIIEPFLLKQEYIWIKRLIEGIIGKGLKTGLVKLMIITRSGEGNKDHIEKLKKDFSDIAEFHHIERVLLHDRNIFTNSYWVSSDYGFMRTYPRGGTKWTNYPIGIYYQDFYERLATSLSFLSTQGYVSNNQLAKGFSA